MRSMLEVKDMQELFTWGCIESLYLYSDTYSDVVPD